MSAAGLGFDLPGRGSLPLTYCQVVAASCGKAGDQEAPVSSLLIRHIDNVLQARLRTRARTRHRLLGKERETCAAPWPATRAARVMRTFK